ncbi:Phox homologous domain [Pseudocohnilembus persalinus]|uniref:Phospholipase n=1 Tax=Pseudocohnilembus persalinus TaxID=266149 RepID=A0A0V0Q958_PSEPJ|nr:Phox homologous domain [Pseudocohnilembus persalinus]|eukprot:KRW98761.1 Phox homologous domain [Pseudocohnilembus persalinus]
MPYHNFIYYLSLLILRSHSIDFDDLDELDLNVKHEQYKLDLIKIEPKQIITLEEYAYQNKLNISRKALEKHNKHNGKEIFELEVIYMQEKWLVKRRWTDLLNLAKQLKKKKSLVKLPDIPSNIKPKDKLQFFSTFFNYSIFKQKSMKQYQEVLEFLEIPTSVYENNQKIKQQYMMKRAGGRYSEGCCTRCGILFGKWSYRYFTITTQGVFYSKNSQELKARDQLMFDHNFQVLYGKSHTGISQGIKLKSSHRNLLIFNSDLFQFVDFLVNVLEAVKKSPYTQKNDYDSFAPTRENVQCKWYVDAEFYFKDLYKFLSLAHKEVFITDWWMSPHLHLLRPTEEISETDELESSRLDILFTRLAKKGVLIKILHWQDHPIAGMANQSLFTKQYLESLHPNIKVLRHPNYTLPFKWSHHEKLVIIDQAIGFIGGLDLCYGRFDNKDHLLFDNELALTNGKTKCWPGRDYCNPRTKDFGNVQVYNELDIQQNQPRMPWHDIHMRVIGEAVIDMCRHFIQYWNHVNIDNEYQNRQDNLLILNEDLSMFDKFKLKMKAKMRFDKHNNNNNENNENKSRWFGKENKNENQSRILSFQEDNNDKKSTLADQNIGSKFSSDIKTQSVKSKQDIKIHNYNDSDYKNKNKTHVSFKHTNEWNSDRKIEEQADDEEESKIFDNNNNNNNQNQKQDNKNIDININIPQIKVENYEENNNNKDKDNIQNQEQAQILKTNGDNCESVSLISQENQVQTEKQEDEIKEKEDEKEDFNGNSNQKEQSSQVESQSETKSIKLNQLNSQQIQVQNKQSIPQIKVHQSSDPAQKEQKKEDLNCFERNSYSNPAITNNLEQGGIRSSFQPKNNYYSPNFKSQFQQKNKIDPAFVKMLDEMREQRFQKQEEDDDFLQTSQVKQQKLKQMSEKNEKQKDLRSSLLASTSLRSKQNEELQNIKGKKLQKDAPILSYNVDHKIQKGNCQVQMLRSASNWSLGINEVENSIMQAYVLQIAEAKHFIFIENQFFISSTAGDIVTNKIGLALITRIKQAHLRREKFRVIIVMPLLPAFAGEIETEGAGVMKIQLHWEYKTICRGDNSIFEQLKNHGIDDPWQYIQVYGLRTHGKNGDGVPHTEQIYVHSKLMIVDDLKVIMGSANINDRSMLGSRDSEVAMLVHDQQVVDIPMAGKPFKGSQFAHTLRVNIFKEHFGLSEEELIDPICDKLDKKINEQTKKNVEIYREIFRCYPDNEFKSYQDVIKARQNQQLDKYDDLIKGVKGNAVVFPFYFLQNESLKFNIFQKENIVPQNSFT